MSQLDRNTHPHDTPNTKRPRPRRLTCCCCGQNTTGRQWWNRDTGFGLCPDCVDFCSRGETPEDVHSCYGVRGVHYDLDHGQEIRRLPTGSSGAALLCWGCFIHEMAWRRERNGELDPFAQYDLPSWESLEVYATVPQSQVCDNCDGEHCFA